MAVLHDLDETVADTASLIVVWRVETVFEVRNDLWKHAVTQFADKVTQSATGNLKRGMNGALVIVVLNRY